MTANNHNIQCQPILNTSPRINGDQIWCNSERQWHRLDGPAYIRRDGGYGWYINGERYYNESSYKHAAGISDEEMLVITLKYGNIVDNRPNQHRSHVISHQL